MPRLKSPIGRIMGIGINTIALFIIGLLIIALHASVAPDIQAVAAGIVVALCLSLIVATLGSQAGLIAPDTPSWARYVAINVRSRLQLVRRQMIMFFKHILLRSIGGGSGSLTWSATRPIGGDDRRLALSS